MADARVRAVALAFEELRVTFVAEADSDTAVFDGDTRGLGGPPSWNSSLVGLDMARQSMPTAKATSGRVLPEQYSSAPTKLW